MALITVNTNIQIPQGATLYYKWKKYTNGVWSSYFTTTSTPYSFSIPYSIDTNIVIEQYLECAECGGCSSNIITYTTNFNCKCNIKSVTNLIVNPCDENTNTYSISLDVGYECMRDEITNAVISAVIILINNDSYTFQPALREGIETFVVEGLIPDGLEKTIIVTCSI